MSQLLRYAWNDKTIRWSEDDLQMAVVQWLTRNGVEHAADQNAGKRSKRDGGRRKALGMKAGEPDLRLYFPGGRLVLVEMKTSIGRMSPDQKKRIPKLKALGFPVFVVAAACPDDAVYMVKGIVEECG